MKVCIEVNDQGQISVGVEAPGGDDAAAGGAQQQAAALMTGNGGQPQDQGGAQMQPVKSIEEALQVAGDLLRNAGQVEQSEDEGMRQGFDKASGPKAGMAQRSGMA